MTKEKANKVYDLLVSIGGAYEPERDSFIYHHTKSNGWCYGAACVAPAVSCIIARVIRWHGKFSRKLYLEHKTKFLLK